MANTFSFTKNIRYFLNKRKQGLARTFDCPEKNFYTSEQFRQRLFIEKRRSERFNCSSSLIVFDFGKFLKSTLNEKNFDQFLKIICSNIRATDFVSLYRNNALLIFLPDTENISAQHVCEKLMNALIASLKSEVHRKMIKSNDFEIEILSYPDKVTEKRLAEDRILHNSDTHNRISRSLDFVTSHKSQFSMNYIDNLNLSISSYNGSSITIPNVNIFFWDQELILTFVRSLDKLAKRVIDIVFSAIGLIILSPIMIMVALLIKLTTRGPILFQQARVGYRGNTFTFYKFRTMHCDSDSSDHQEFMKKLINGKNQEINNGENEIPFYKMKNDSRITAIGRLLRKASLDELPQLWNVLKGEMSLVGPRPPIDYEVEEYQNWHYRRIIEVRPGITGLWQVSGRNRTTFDEMVRLDIHYAQHWSFLMDLKILFKTAIGVFRGEGI